MTRRRLTALAIVLALSTALTGCVQWFLPSNSGRTSTSTPAAEDVAAELQPFYQQRLSWHSCNSTFWCATAEVPLDWSKPGGERIKLALIEHRATGSRLGALLVNPGGPGASGVDFLRDSLSYAVDSTLEAHYDVVGFDPRGVGASTAVKCVSSPTQLDDYLFTIIPGTPGSDSWLAQLAAQNVAFGKGCQQLTGALLAHVDTGSAARDLDVLRAALGDAKLNYLGYSYGTYLGARYAGLFPSKVGRLVLDGALDPTTSSFDVTLAQATSFEKAYRSYLASCLRSSGCPFSGTVDQAMATTQRLFTALQANPLRNSDGRELGTATMFTAVIYPLYSQDNWGYLNSLFAQVFKGKTSVAFQLADAYYSRDESTGRYADNSTEAFTAINCLDYPSGITTAEMRSEAAQLSQQAPLFGPLMSWGDNCQSWPIQSTQPRDPISAAGSGPIVVVGTTGDPATPYAWAVSLAKQLQNGHLVTRVGEGHTGYNKGNSCVNSAVDNYFVSATVPASGLRC